MSRSTEPGSHPPAAGFFQPLRHLRVLDFTQIGAGPLCGMYLGDMGADVIKIEPPGGDLGRQLGLPWIDGESPVYVAFNRNKRGICIDLKSAAGLEVVHRLLEQADVLLESFRPGVMARFGLDYATLAERYPRLVYCSLSAYGQSGPDADKPGVDGIIQGTSALMSLIGTEESGPCKVQSPVVDVTAGFAATIGTLAQLLARVQTGQGGHIDVSLFASAVALQQPSVATYLGTGELPVRAGSEAPYAAPNEAFETSDGWIMVAAYNGNRWEELCRVLGIAAMAAHPRLATLDARVANRAFMKDVLGPVFKGQPTAHWLQVLTAADILCGQVCTYEQLAVNPQALHLNLFTPATDAAGRTFSSPAFPVNSRRQAPATGAPACGQHTREILAGLGYEAEAISALLEQRAVQGPPQEA